MARRIVTNSQEAGTRNGALVSDAAVAFMLAQPVTFLRDSIWGDVPLFDKEIRLIDTLPFQRLRRIQQLGFTSLTYPGARHSRFEHSLGVYMLTRQVITHLLRQPQHLHLTTEDLNTVLAAALLHDVGHYPYSHSLEELELRYIRKHEDIGAEIITGPEVGSVLREHWRVDPARVARIMHYRTDLSPQDALLHEIISGSVDTDKLDYLVRDARHCNVAYGAVDVERLIQSLRLHRDPVSGDVRLVLDDKGVGPMQSLVFSKYMMFFNVYWHHTTRIATMMFLRALQDVLGEGLISAAELEHSDDYSILYMVLDRTPKDSVAAELTQRLLGRQLYKRGAVLQPWDRGYAALVTMKRDPERRKQLEAAWCAILAERTGRVLRGHEILLDTPDSRSFDVPLEVLQDWERTGEPRPVLWETVSGLGTEDMDKFRERIQQVRIFASDVALAEAVHLHCDDLLQHAAQSAGAVP